ncbi:MAG: nitronate monooxygenase [Candidatus Omnitrophica bacterium]|nr:nitronate monooxygenase [Candidatus Omnitrophota bacterium]
MIEPLIIGDLKLKVPILQGGMGVKISLAPLAAAVANCGAGGTIASVGLPPDTQEEWDKYTKIAGYEHAYPTACIQYLKDEIQKARSLSNGVIGVNIMVALSNYEEMVRAAAKENIDFIISGAGPPISLPEFAEGSSVKLIPLVASARGAQLIIKTWKRRYNRFPDAIVVEGPLSGGHIAGYKFDELVAMQNTLKEKPLLEKSIQEVLELVKGFEKDNGINIPVIAAGGVFDGKDMAKFLKMGAKGVQIGTRFVATPECSAADELKRLYVRANEEDLVFIQSPVGMPARTIRTKFVDKIMRGEGEKFDCKYRCLRTCDPATVPYCIAKALLNAFEGNIDQAVVLAGSNIQKITEIRPVKDIIKEIVAEAQDELDK